MLTVASGTPEMHERVSDLFETTRMSLAESRLNVEAAAAALIEAGTPKGSVAAFEENLRQARMNASSEEGK